jgi:hypothetical protein
MDSATVASNSVLSLVFLARGPLSLRYGFRLPQFHPERKDCLALRASKEGLAAGWQYLYSRWMPLVRGNGGLGRAVGGTALVKEL